jgi:hypothetical protein
LVTRERRCEESRSAADESNLDLSGDLRRVDGRRSCDEGGLDLIGIESKVSPGFVIQDARATAK